MKLPKPNIVPQTAEVLYPDDSSMGFVNEYEFNQIRIQVKQNQLEGYRVKYKDQVIPIAKNGRLPFWPEGFFDLYSNQLSELID